MNQLEVFADSLYSYLRVYQLCNVLMWSLPQFPWILIQCAQHLPAFAFLKGSVNSGFQPCFCMTAFVQPVPSLSLYLSLFLNAQFFCFFLRTNKAAWYRPPSEPRNITGACDLFPGNKADSIFSTLDST